MLWEVVFLWSFLMGGRTKMKVSKATKAQLKRQRRRKRLRRLKAACLSIGLATAWGGEAEADSIRFRVTANPSTTITNAYVYFSNNATTGLFRSIGTLPANETTERIVSFNFGGSNVIDEYRPRPGAGNGDPNPGYVILGTYDQVDLEQGVVLSSMSSAPIDNNSTWGDLFSKPTDPSYSQFEESEIIDSLINGNEFAPTSTGFEGAFLYFSASDIPDPLLRTPYGLQSYLIGFSAAQSAGTAIVEIIPEPATLGLVVFAAGTLILGSARRRE